MINLNDLASIDTDYFEIKEIKEYSLVLRSKNTGHFWYLLEQVYNGNRSFLIHHKHSTTKAYHRQKSRPDICACCEYIRDHDTFHLERKKKKEALHRKRFATQSQ